MAVQLIPPGPNANTAAVLQNFYDAITDLQNPGAPVQLGHVPTKAKLPPADAYRGGVIVCDEINAIVMSTSVSGAYVWLRVDGSTL